MCPSARLPALPVLEHFLCHKQNQSALIGLLCISWSVYTCRRNSQQSEEIVAELVYRFLIPEVQKIAVRERGELFNPADNQ